MKTNKLFFLALIFLSFQSKAAFGIQDYIQCLASYESKTIGTDIDQAELDYESALKYRLPDVTTAVSNQKEFLHSSSQEKNVNWTAGISQNIYSYSAARAVDAKKYLVNSSVEKTKKLLQNKVEDQLEILFQYILALENRSLAMSQIQQKTNLKKVYQEMSKARIVDGSSLLLAQSDLLIAEKKLQDINQALEQLEAQLATLSFFKKSMFSDGSKSTFFSFQNSLGPTSVEEKPEIKELGYFKLASKSQFLAEDKAWLPSLDASLVYSQAVNNPERINPTDQLMGTLTLTIPLTNFYTKKAHQNYYQNELNRKSTLLERYAKALSIENSSDLKLLNKEKKALSLFEESKSLLEKTREITLRKVQLNKAGYFDIANLEDRIDRTVGSLVQSRVTVWKILSKWQTQQSIQKLPTKENSSCQF